ncbi:MAG: dehypoxanthine futalosine cyclase [Desulfohalobiaceae bacterium]|nr:dehypoxanthine futalosine cyclase [Desulfohalobiaceae bacterium]
MIKPEINRILTMAEQGSRLEKGQALSLYLEADFFDLAAAAHERRMEIHPGNVVTYVVDRNINYSNVCVCGCKFCAFYRRPGQEGGFVLSREELGRKIEETLALGGTQILLQGSHHPDLDLSFYEDLLAFIKKQYPGIHIHGFSPPEIIHFAEVSSQDPEEVLKRLMHSGLDSIPGGGAEILVDRVRKLVSPNKCSAGRWLQVMRSAHRLGLRTTATMMFGHRETPGERVEHLFALRELQDETGGFTAFIPWTFQPDNTRLSAERTTSVEYLRTLALSRIVLDNFPNLQVSWVTMGAKIGQLGLFFGANDFGSTMIEENVVAASGVDFKMSRQEIEDTIQEAGFIPCQRRMDYSPV